MPSNSINKPVLILCVLALTFSSCKLLKKKPSNEEVAVDTTSTGLSEVELADSMQGELVTVMEPDVRTPDKQALIDMLVPLWKKHATYSTFKGKAKMHYEGGGQKQDFTANIRMAKDSVIWIHITAGMGLVNVARVYITPDSFQLVNYLERTGIKMPITEAEELLPAAVDFDLLQHFIMGEALTEPVQKVTNATDVEDAWMLDIYGVEASQKVALNKADSTIRSQQVLSSTGGFAGLIRYGNYSLINSRKFATGRAINIQNKGELHYIEMNFNSASFDEEMSFPFNIPDSYTLNK